MSSPDKPVLKVAPCSHEAAKYAVENWHYSRTMPKSKLVKFGIWEDAVFVGCIIYGVGATSDLVKAYGLKMEEGCELVRIALRQHQHAVSRMVAISMRLLKKHSPGLRLCVSFADPEQGHHGGVYQAGGWIHNGHSAANDEYIYKGKRWQGRSFRNNYKGMERHPDVTIVKGSSKLRYLYPLDEDMKRKIEPLRKPYPKRAGSSSVERPISGGEAGGSTPTPALKNPEPTP